MDNTPDRVEPIVSRPRVESAAIAGIVYAVATVVALLFMRAVPVDSTATEWEEWISDDGHRRNLYLAANLASLSAVAFLWFVAVVRRRLGAREDKFFSTVFFGSSLVYVAVWLVAASVVAAPAVLESLGGGTELTWETYQLAEGVAGSLLFIAAPRIQAVFVASTSMVFLRTRIVPDWLGYLGFVIALGLFVVPILTIPAGVGLPVFVLLSSLTILFTRVREDEDDDAGA